MTKFLYTILSLSILMTFVVRADVVLAYGVCVPGGSCSIPFGGAQNLRVVPYDTYGNNIVAPVNYSWTTTVGTFSLGEEAGSSGASSSPATTWTDNTNSKGWSTVLLSVPNDAESNSGVVNVTASYGTGTASATFNLSGECNGQASKLLYGIGRVEMKDGAIMHEHQSTAEVLKTCSDQYLLYGGMGGAIVQ